MGAWAAASRQAAAAAGSSPGLGLPGPAEPSRAEPPAPPAAAPETARGSGAGGRPAAAEVGGGGGGGGPGARRCRLRKSSVSPAAAPSSGRGSAAEAEPPPPSPSPPPIVQRRTGEAGDGGYGANSPAAAAALSGDREPPPALSPRRTLRLPVGVYIPRPGQPPAPLLPVSQGDPRLGGRWARRAGAGLLHMAGGAAAAFGEETLTPPGRSDGQPSFAWKTRAGREGCFPPPRFPKGAEPG